MAAQTDELRAMIAALAGSQALTLDALRRRGSIDQEDIDYILAVTEQGIAKAVGTASRPKSVVQMIRMCLQQLSISKSPRHGEPLPIQSTGKQINGTPFGGLLKWRDRGFGSISLQRGVQIELYIGLGFLAGRRSPPPFWRYSRPNRANRRWPKARGPVRNSWVFVIEAFRDERIHNVFIAAILRSKQDRRASRQAPEIQAYCQHEVCQPASL